MSDETSTNHEESAGASAATAESRFESGKSHAKHAAEDLRAAAEAKAQELRKIAEAKASEFRGKAEEALGDAKVRVRTLREDGETYVRDNPVRAVATALGVGFLLGLIFRR